MKDPDILFLSQRVDVLEKIQRDILTLLKKVLSPTEYSAIDEIAQRTVTENRQVLRGLEQKTENIK